MPNFREVYLLDEASAVAVREATKGGRSRLDPTMIELGPYAGKYVVPANVIGDPRFSSEVQSLIGDAHMLVNLDHDELWPMEEARKD